MCMKRMVLVLLKSGEDRTFLNVLRCLQASRSVKYSELRKQVSRSAFYDVLQKLEIINQGAGEHTGRYFLVREKKRLGKHLFENVLYIQGELEFIKSGAFTLVRVLCANM